MVKDVYGVELTEENNQYVYLRSETSTPRTFTYNVSDGKGVGANTKIADKYYVSDSKLKINNVEYTYSYDGSELRITVEVSNEDISIVLPRDLIVDKLGNAMREDIPLNIEVTDSVFSVESVDTKYNNKYYAVYKGSNNDYTLTFVLKLLESGKTIKTITLPSGYSSEIKEGKREATITREVSNVETKEYSSTFEVTVELKDGNTFVETVEFINNYVLDKTAPSKEGTVTINGNNASVEKVYTNGNLISIVYTFDEDLDEGKLPVLYIGYGSSEETLSGTVTIKGQKVDSKTVKYETMASSVEGNLYIKLGKIVDIAGNEKVEEENYTETKVKVDNTAPELEVSTNVTEGNYVKVGDSVTVTIVSEEAVTYDVTNIGTLTNINSYLDVTSTVEETDGKTLTVTGTVKGSLNSFVIQVKAGFAKDVANITNDKPYEAKEVKVLRVVNSIVSLEGCNENKYCNETDKIVVEVEYNHEISADLAGTVAAGSLTLVNKTVNGKVHRFEYDVVGEVNEEVSTFTLTNANVASNTITHTYGTIVIDTEEVSAPSIVAGATAYGANKQMIFTISFEYEEGLRLTNNYKNGIEVRIDGAVVASTVDSALDCGNSADENRACKLRVYANSGAVSGEVEVKVFEVVEDRAGNKNLPQTLTGVTVDAEEPTVSATLEGTDKYYTNASDSEVKVNITVTEGSIASGKKICLLDKEGNKVGCKTTVTPVEGQGLTSGQIATSAREVTFSLNGAADGAYKVYMEGGFASDEVNNPSIEYTSEILFYVGSNNAVVEIVNIQSEFTQKYGITTYAYFDRSARTLSFDIEVSNGTLAANVCSFVTLHDGTRTYANGEGYI